jgi:CHAD domain-containing protein
MFSKIPMEVLSKIEPTGLDFWMDRVLTECDRIGHNLDSAAVHDLRVALRRCRSIADGFMAFDPHPAWKRMKFESKRLFQELGALRDTQVMLEWVQSIAPAQDEASCILRSYLEDQESRHRKDAVDSVLQFSAKKWASWTRLLSGHTRRIPLESVAFQHLALERLGEAHKLHQQAMRNRSHAAYHRLRIGLKKFRYIVENFMPSRHERWGVDLRELQDILGELHDLDVLWRTAASIRAFRDEKTRVEWRNRIREEGSNRIDCYRAKMSGKTSLFLIWRSELPSSGQLRDAALASVRTWAAFRDPDIPHSEHVAKLALQIYDGLDTLSLPVAEDLPDARRILESAALAHAVGSRGSQKNPQVDSYRLIRKLPPPLGLDTEILRNIALIARFHRGALPRLGKKAWAGIPEGVRKSLILLCGILRLADALSRPNRRHIHRVEVRQAGEVLCLTVPGYAESNRSAEKIAAARHLLEIACRMPIVLRN